MYRIVIEYAGSPWLLHAVKEELAMCCERHGDCRVVSIEDVRETGFQQMSIGGGYGKQ